MNILSIFDGMSCLRIVLDKLQIPVTNYFASEIDKYAIQVSKANWKDVQHIGDVTKVKGADLPRIDLLAGGSPCQDLRPGRDGLVGSKSKLFYEYYRLLKEIQNDNPEVFFFFENTSKMKKEDRNIITELLKVNFVEINSALVSAQNRRRLYWTNIPFFGQPTDKNITLQDILQWEVDNKYNVTEKFIQRFYRRHSAYKGQIDPVKTGVLNTKNNSSHQLIDNGTSLISVVAHSTHSRCSKVPGGKGPLYKTDDKSYCLDSSIGTLVSYGNTFRRLTPIECERLQGVNDNYTAFVSESRRYEMLGNGWQIDTIEHLLEPLKYVL